MQRVSWLSGDSEASLYLLWQKSIMLSVNCSSQRRWTNAGDKGSHHSVWKPCTFGPVQLSGRAFFSLFSPFFGGGGGWKVRKSGMQERKDLFFQKCKLKAEMLWLVQTDCFGTGQGRKIILEVLTLSGCLYIPVTHSDLISSETTVPFCRHLEPRC